jgi:hypothetical protein
MSGLNTNTYTLAGASGTKIIAAKGHRILRYWISGDFGGGDVAIKFGPDAATLAPVKIDGAAISHSEPGGSILELPEGILAFALSGATGADLTITVSTTLA